MMTAHLTTATRAAITSTVGALSDRELLRETSNLVRHERHLQGAIIDHLAEIEARGLHLQRGFSSLFDYAVRELGYSDAAAARRIGAMRLCADQPHAREGLRDGSLTLSAAAELQWAFDRQRRRGSISGTAAIAPAGSAAQTDPAADSAPSVPVSSAESQPPPLVLDAVGRQKLVDEAAGKSARQVRQMLANLDPELAPPADRVRPLGDGRYELKATIDAECQQGLEQLRGLLSHVDPRMTMGQLVGRLVKEALDRHDPSRPPRRARSGSRPADAKANAPPTPTPEQAHGSGAPAAKRALRPAHTAAAPKTDPNAGYDATPTPARSVRPIPTSAPLSTSSREDTARQAVNGAKPTGAHHRHGHAQGRSPREPAPWTAASPKGAPQSVSPTRNPEDPARFTPVHWFSGTCGAQCPIQVGAQKPQHVRLPDELLALAGVGGVHGEMAVGHLQQLGRMAGTPERREHARDWVTGTTASSVPWINSIGGTRACTWWSGDAAR